MIRHLNSGHYSGEFQTPLTENGKHGSLQLHGFEMIWKTSRQYSFSFVHLLGFKRQISSDGNPPMGGLPSQLNSMIISH